MQDKQEEKNYKKHTLYGRDEHFFHVCVRENYKKLIMFSVEMWPNKNIS